ncbi:MAG: aminotransferase [Lachnospiraceae bacterium]
MQTYLKMSREELIKEKEELYAQFLNYKAEGLMLDMSRGKPSAEQLDLGMDLLNVLNSESILITEDGVDCRNYGVNTGITEAKTLIAQMLDCRPEQVLIMGNSSLNVMYDSIARSFTHGIMGNTPWCRLDTIKFLCPVPGYDRHFGVTEHFGIEMISIPTDENGPDMDMVEELVSKDETIKGIWCIPKYSNPTGITYSDDVVRRFASLKPAAADFRIYWDNAYMVHDMFEDRKDYLLNILDECEKAGNPDIVFEFCSTSKVSFAGSGISAMACSKVNCEDMISHLAIQTIGHDKINQLRHVKYFGDRSGVDAHMQKQAALIRPKFEMVFNALEEEIRPLEIADWNVPNGGYFICFYGMPHTAKAIVALAKEAGLVMTPAGAPFPYGKDPEDSVIRIAPTYPDLKELKLAVAIFIDCVKLATVERLLKLKDGAGY